MAEALESLSIQSVLVTPAANGFAPMTMAVGLLPNVLPPTAPPATIPAENPPERLALAFSDGVSFRYSSQDIAACSSVFPDVTSSATALTLLSTGTASTSWFSSTEVSTLSAESSTTPAPTLLSIGTASAISDDSAFSDLITGFIAACTDSAGSSATTVSDTATSAVMPPKALTLLSLTLVTTKIPAISAAAAESPQNQTGMTFLRLSCSPAFSLSAAHNSSDGRSS